MSDAARFRWLPMIGIFLLLGAVGALLFMLSSRPPTASSGVDPALATRPSPASPQVGLPDTSKAPPPLRRPAPGASLAQRYASLAQSVQAGDTAALRQLVTDLKRCQDLPQVQQALGMQQVLLDPSSRIGSQLQRTDLSAPQRAEVATMAAQFRQNTAAIGSLVSAEVAFCGPLSSRQLAAYGDWLYRLARMGDREGVLAFARGEHIHANPFDSLEHVARWREQAPVVLGKALSNGEKDAPWMLGHMYDPDTPFDGTLPKAEHADAQRALAYYLLAQRIGQCGSIDCGLRIEQLNGQLDDHARAAAGQLAAQLCTRSLSETC